MDDVTNSPATVELGPQDAALIIQADGSIKVVIPAQADDDIVSQNSMLLTAFVSGIATQSPHVTALIRDLEKRIDQMDNMN